MQLAELSLPFFPLLNFDLVLTIFVIKKDIHLLNLLLGWFNYVQYES